MKKRIISLILALLMILTLLPVTAFAEGTTQTGTATLIGFAAGQKASNAYIQNNGMTILDATGTGGNNPMTSYGAVGQTATLSPYCPPYGQTLHPEYVYSESNATAIIVQNADGSGTQRRLLKGDTFKAGMTYRFTFQDTSWPVTSIVKGGGYLGELEASNFTISGAKVVKVERVAQKISTTIDREMQGFFYNVWITIDGPQNNYAVQYTATNATVSGLSNTTTAYPSKTGYAKEGTTITVTAEKSKDVGNEERWFFTGWQFTTTDDDQPYTSEDYICWYCNVTDYVSNESGSDKVTCSFRMGDKPLKIEALYSKPGSAGVGNVTFNNIKLWVMPPVKGARGVVAAVPEFDAMGATYQIGKVEWLEDNETGSPNYLGMDSSKAFDTANKCYTMRVVLKLNNGYAFSDENGVTITINGKTYGTGTQNPLYDREDRTIPVTYNYNEYETSKSLAIYISVGGDGVKTRLEDRYKAYAALKFVDAPSIDSVTVTDASNNLYGTKTASGFTMPLAQGINYSVNVKVRVPQAIQTAIDKDLMQLLPQFRYLVKDTDTGTNLWQGSQPDKATDSNGDTIYTYSTKFSPVAGENYMLTFGTNLMTTGADAQLIATNAISGTFNGIATKISTVNIQLNRPVDTKDISENTLPAYSLSSGISELTSSTNWYKSSDSTAYRKQIVLVANSGSSFANDVTVTCSEGVSIVETPSATTNDGYSYLTFTIEVTPKKVLTKITGTVTGLTDRHPLSQFKITSGKADINSPRFYTVDERGKLQRVTGTTIDDNATYCIFVSVTPKDGYVIRGECTVVLEKEGLSSHGKPGKPVKIAELTRYDRTTDQALQLGGGLVGQYYGLISLTTNTPQKLGDLNWDGSVNVSDVQALYEYLTQGIVPTAGKNPCDLNKDGSIDVYDLQYLYELVIGLI